MRILQALRLRAAVQMLFRSCWRNEMLRVYWLLIWVVRAAARATRAARDNDHAARSPKCFNTPMSS